MQPYIFWTIYTCGIFFCSALAASSREKSTLRHAIPPIQKGIVAPLEQNQNDESIEKYSGEGSPELLLEQPTKRRALPISSQEGSKENGSENSGSPERSNETSTPDLNGRKRLYAALQRNEHEVVKELLMRIALTQQLASRQKIAKNYETMKQLLPRFNDILREGLQPFPSYTYVDMLCSVPAWHEALMGIFFDELARGILGTSSQTLRARYYAVKCLEQSLKKIIPAFFVMMDFEDPQLITPAVKTFLNPELVSQTFEYFLYEQLTGQLQHNGNRIHAADYDTDTQEIGIFEQLATLEKKGTPSPEKGHAQTSAVTKE